MPMTPLTDDRPADFGAWYGGTPWERARRDLDYAGGGHVAVPLGLYGPTFMAWLHLHDRGEVIEAVFQGSTVAVIRPDRVALFAHGWGHSPATRAVLSWCSGRGGLTVHSHRRMLYVDGTPFREGITLDYDGRVLDPGEGDHVDGCKPRRRRGDDGVLR